jgi:hypothetical protein
MHKLMGGLTAVLLCSAFALTDSPLAAARGLGGGFARGAGGFHAFHGAGPFHHGSRGFYGGGIYPYSLFGYPNYLYGGYYPYSIYEDSSPDCDFVWVKRTVKHKIVQRGVWKCL